MNCPNCQTVNPDHAKFCLECGTSLLMRCEQCQTPLPISARFCLNCGQPVGRSTPTDEVRQARLAAALPAPLAAQMQAPRLAGERRVVTALFADVVGSTALAEQMDAEEWVSVMNGAFDRLFPTIYRYEGSIARLLGDAMLAFFGAPVAHEDDPVRAVRAALDLLDAAREYAAEVRARHGIDFAVRVGLNTGPVVVGEVGSDLKYEYTALGDAVNLAARLQSAARPMTIVVSEQTQRFAAPLFDFTDLGWLDVRGRSEPVRIYEVRGPKPEPGRLRGLAGLTSPMVGRAAELERLRERGHAVWDGEGHIAVIVGEPGLGKSRLIAEWRASLADLPLYWAEGRCLSYGQGLTHHLLLDLLRSLLGVAVGAGEAETRTALAARVAELGGEVATESYAALGHLLSLNLDGQAHERMAALDLQALRASYLAALRHLLLDQANRRPLVLVLDDIHWADPSSIDLLVRLLPLAQEAPLLFCIVTRPDETAPGWGLVTAARDLVGPALTEIALKPLSDGEGYQLVSNLLEIEAIPAPMRALILRKADGNPFFVEEVIRMLIDRGALVRDGDRWTAGAALEHVEVPDNLQGLLLARIDRLSDEARRALRVASVIGRQFDIELLTQVLAREAAG